MRLPSWWDTTFLGEILLLALVAPLIYFPARFPPAATTALIFALPLAVWLWRRWRLGIWHARTPVDWPICFLILVMLPIALWVAPLSLRDHYSWPKVYVLIWCFTLFYTITTHARRPHLFNLCLAGFIATGSAIALLAPLGTNWLFKLPGSRALLSHMPTFLGDLSREGPRGFHPNMIAGALLYVLPVLIGLTWALYRHYHHPHYHRPHRHPIQGISRRLWLWLALAATAYMSLVFALLQSRGGIIGLLVALLVMLLIHHAWGRRALLIGTLALLMILPFFFEALITLISDSPAVVVAGGVNTLENFRLQLWRQALIAIQDFPFTGSGLGIFQEVSRIFYPTTIDPNYYFGHAHNFWLQIAIDFGLPGLLAVISIYAAGLILSYRLWRGASTPLLRGIALGFLGALSAHLAYGMTDSVSMGSTPNLLFWYLFALVFAASKAETTQAQP